MRLDVGCGNNPTGNVNVDLFMNEETLHIDSRKNRFIELPSEIHIEIWKEAF
jgi:hypothetical protein